jgi:beta-phosphoglucomutase-like phosphatase (HAD superfamily)
VVIGGDRPASTAGHDCTIAQRSCREPETFDLGIGSDVRTCLFDLDGVLTRTTTVHAAAWREMFDAYRRARAERAPRPFCRSIRLLSRVCVPACHRASEGAVFEDAPAGVEAGRAGGFGCMVGVDRVGQAGELRRHGADIVVSDLGDLLASP